MIALLDCMTGLQDWDPRQLATRIGGLTLLERHLFGLDRAGVRKVVVVIPSHHHAWLERELQKARLPGIMVEIRESGAGVDVRLRQRADTLIDLRLYTQIGEELEGSKSPMQMSLDAGYAIEFVDRSDTNLGASAKSPYRVGVPERDEAETVDGDPSQTCPIGLWLDPAEADKGVTRMAVGRYFWHRISGPADRRSARWKILLATMKVTDGIYARTNRRVSLPISYLLIETPITANMVTLFALFLSALSGALLAVGTYSFQVLGAFMAWFSSMLDGVDGELARSRFQQSDFGCWLEMVCDYAFYIFFCTGLGLGLTRTSGDWIWLLLGVGASVGVVLSFALVAALRRRYAAEDNASNFGLAFQRRVETRRDNPLHRFIRLASFLATRAACPYYFFFFALLGQARLLLIICFTGTTITWPLVLYSFRLFARRPKAAPSAGARRNLQESKGV